MAHSFPKVKANGLELAYESVGSGEPVLLIMGIGVQLVHWPEGFVSHLVDQGFRVIRFDNRDVGESSKLGDARVPSLQHMVLRRALNFSIDAPYRLEDMADDAAALLDALELESANVVGVSMGGMIAQTMAINHPRRVRSLTSIMSHTGCRRFLVSEPRAMRLFLRDPPRSREQAMDYIVDFYNVVGSTGFARDVSEIRERAGRAYDRCHYPKGFVRHFAAIMASGSRKKKLGALRMPTAVVHGSVDPLIRPAGGRATANAIDGARFDLIDGMGHDLPKGAWSRIVDNVKRVAN